MIIIHIFLKFSSISSTKDQTAQLYCAHYSRDVAVICHSHNFRSWRTERPSPIFVTSMEDQCRLDNFMFTGRKSLAVIIHPCCRRCSTASSLALTEVWKLPKRLSGSMCRSAGSSGAGAVAKQPFSILCKGRKYPGGRRPGHWRTKAVI